MAVLQLFVELVVPYVGVALAETEKQRRARRSANRRRGVVIGQHDPAGGQRVQGGSHLPGLAAVVVGPALVLPEGPDVSPAHVVDQDEDDVRFGRRRTALLGGAA